jgi:hypothetical protein
MAMSMSISVILLTVGFLYCYTTCVITLRVLCLYCYAQRYFAECRVAKFCYTESCCADRAGVLILRQIFEFVFTRQNEILR